MSRWLRAILGACLAGLLGLWPGMAVSETVEADVAVQQARERVLAGDTEGAQTLWHEIGRQAMAKGDLERLDLARDQEAQLAFDRGDYERFSRLQQAREKTAIEHDDERSRTWARMQLAVLARRLGQMDAAGEALNQSIEAFRKLDDRDGEGQALNHLGLVLLARGEYAQAREALDQALELHRAGADVHVERTWHYIGLLYHRLQEFDTALEHLQRGLEVARTLPDPQRAAPLFGSLAQVSNDAGRPARALEYARESQLLAERLKSVSGRIFSQLERGRALLELGRLKEARSTLERVLEDSESIGQMRTRTDALYMLGKVALEEGRDALAVEQLGTAAAVYESMPDRPQMLLTYRAMIAPLQRLGRQEEALDLAKQALELQEQLSDRDIGRRIALVEYRHREQENERQIEALKKETEIQRLTLENQHRMRSLGIGLIAILLGVIGLLVLAFSRVREHRRALSSSNAELEISRRELAEVNDMLARRANVLMNEANTDPLTGLANRRHVRSQLKILLEQANQEHRPLAVMMLDLDWFKRINDTFGHNTGDRVLRSVARHLMASMPGEAISGRYGGEEFLVVLPDHTMAEAQRCAEQIRRDIERSDFCGPGEVTVSIGVAAKSPWNTAHDEELVEGADQALYRAKRSGRNQVRVALQAA